MHISLNYIYTETPPLNQPMRLNHCNCGVIISIVELTEWQCIRDINDLFRTNSLSAFFFFSSNETVNVKTISLFISWLRLI